MKKDLKRKLRKAKQKAALLILDDMVLVVEGSDILGTLQDDPAGDILHTIKSWRKQIVKNSKALHADYYLTH
jgi:hypothetical protein